MNHLVVAAASVNTTPLAWGSNYSAILGALQEARQEGVEVLCFPELCLTGYGCEDAFPSAALLQQAQKQLYKLAGEPQLSGMVAVGLPLMYQNALFNVTAVIYRGSILGFVPKQHLAADGLHYEPRWFREWPAGKRGVVTLFDNRTYPIGDLIFNLDGVRIGFEVCEDAWVADRPGARLARRGVDIILNPSASHFAFGKHSVRERFVLEGSRAYGVTYVYANLLGNEAGRAIYDGDTLIASGGNLLARGPRFSYKPYVLTVAEVDVEATRTTQLRTGSYRPSFDDEGVITEGPPHRQEEPLRAQEDDNRIQTRGGWVQQKWAPRTADVRPVEFERFEEFERAVSLGLWDYMRKSGSHGFVISLSGGADSAACAYLVQLMVLNGIRDIGAVPFLRSIGLNPDELQGARVRDYMSRILTCVYQGTENSSETTRTAARAVAEEIGAEYHVLDVQPVVDAYRGMISAALGRPLTWENADVALQNIQARVRAPSVWMFANLKNALLVTTSNRSEASVGYCTMDGDTAGSLAPIGGIDKPFIREWLASRVKTSPALRLIIEQQPTAELRPASEAQTDEKDLMPYEVLDAAEKALVIGKKSPLEVYRTLRAMFPVYTRDDIRLWVERYFTLWCRNQWKRERFAPSLHLDDENLDPKTWCRFPILSGGYRDELAALNKAFAEGL